MAATSNLPPFERIVADDDAIHRWVSKNLKKDPALCWQWWRDLAPACRLRLLDEDTPLADCLRQAQAYHLALRELNHAARKISLRR